MSKIRTLLRSTGNGVFLAICLILAVQAMASRMLTIDERKIMIPGLQQLPMDLGKWKASGEESLDKDVKAYLRPDDYIIRDYGNPETGSSINLFVAYFKSLQNSYGPHSPRICLPGNGWWVRSSKIASVWIPDQKQSIPVNEYLLDKSGDRILVLYWYQNDRNIWAEEFEAKLRLLPDLIRYKRADVSLVRLVTPLRSDGDTANTLATTIEFTRLVFPRLVERFATGK
jgi:EpsI family protein